MDEDTRRVEKLYFFTTCFDLTGVLGIGSCFLFVIACVVMFKFGVVDG